MIGPRFLLAVAGCFFGLISAHAATTTINGVTYDSTKSAGVVDEVRFKKFFLFPSLDDISGVLAPKLDEKLTQLFAKNPRFDLVRDPQVVRALSPGDASYAKAAQNIEVHKEAARVTGSDTTAILRTRGVGNQTEMTLEFRDAQGKILLSESGAIPGFSSMEARWGLIEKLFQTIVSKIPFDGTVTGRTASTITIDLGMSSIKQGEIIELARIVSLQRHPLLGTVVGSDYVRVGRAKVTNVDRALSFAEIQEEYSGEMIAVGSKVLRTKSPISYRTGEPVPEKGNRKNAKEVEEGDPFDDRLQGDFDRPRARFGHLGFNLQYGSLTHAQNPEGLLPTEYSGSGLGGNVESELWITKQWIFSAGYGFHNAKLSSVETTIGSGSWYKAEAAVGFRFFPDPMGAAHITGSIGYQLQNFSIPAPAALSVGGKKYSGILLRVDGEMPLHPQHKFTGGFSFQPFSSFSDLGGSLGEPDGATVIGFHLAWNYLLADSLWVRLGFQFDTASGHYKNSSSVTDKRFAIGPGIFYSF